MGHKISVIRGVKSDHFYNQQNGINEIWVGDVEVISRLPFGDSDQEQSSWPPGGVPKIPWHHFIIPLHKRDELGNMAAQTVPGEHSVCTCDRPLPTAGYMGMYSGLHPRVAELLGIFFLCWAVVLGLYCLASLERFLRLYSAISSGIKNGKGIEKGQLPPSDSSLFSTCFSVDGNFLLRGLESRCSWCAFTLIAGILCVIMGLPAFAAGSKNAEAAEYIFSFGCSMSIAYVILMTISLFVMVGKSVYLTRALKAITAEDALVLTWASAAEIFALSVVKEKTPAQTQPV